MRVPSIFLKGSGSFALDGSDVGTFTAQSAPSSSTPVAARLAAARAVVVRPPAMAAPPTAKAATASATIPERIVERLDLMVTNVLLPVGAGRGAELNR